MLLAYFLGNIQHGEELQITVSGVPERYRSAAGSTCSSAFTDIIDTDYGCLKQFAAKMDSVFRTLLGNFLRPEPAGNQGGKELLT
ncbi:hypothetical protein D3C74_375570 [compost metagenome]